MNVSPFRGIRYNRRIVGEVGQVICPPYDVITVEQQKLHYAKSDYSVIRLELPEPTEDRYARAAITFGQWLKQGILQRDSASSFYVHDHIFEYSGETMTRRGLIARVRLEPWGNGIYPHEETSSKAKADRLQLMRACRANFSPLFCLYHDSGQEVAGVLAYAVRGRPLMSLRTERSNLLDSNEAHLLWAITDGETQLQLSRHLFSWPLYVADGHHRYETALAYQQERAQCDSDGCKVTAEGADYVMMELVEFSDPGLVVLPLHRLVRGVARSILTNLAGLLSRFFVLEYISLEAEDCKVPADSFLGVLGLRPGWLVALKRREDVSFESMMPGSRSEAYRDFGVSIINHIIVDNVLSGCQNLDMAYTVDLREAHRDIEQGKYQLAFLLNPPRLETIRAVAAAGDRLPRKSTYFHPKLPAGLVINSLD